MTDSQSTELSNKKLAAGLCGIFLGAFGVHKFILGYTKAGIIMLVVSVAGGVVTWGGAFLAMSVIGLIEGIIYLTKSPEEFESAYISNSREWF